MIRFHLENLYNEETLLIKNHRVNLKDVKKQERDFKGLHVYERIPITKNTQDLQEQIQESAKEVGIQLLEIRFLPQPQETRSKLPDHILSNDRNFHLQGNQIADEIPFQLCLSGDSKKIQTWITSWNDQIMRYIEPRGEPRVTAQGTVVKGAAFHFKDLKYPRIEAQDPMHFLPESLRSTPNLFARQEPKLWEKLVQTKKIIPEAAPYYSDMEQFQLNDARMTFYISKVSHH